MANTKIRALQIQQANANDGLIDAHVKAGANIATSKLAEGALLIKKDGTVAMTGALNLGDNRITNVGAATLATDAVNKGQLESAQSSLEGSVSAETAARVAADAALQTAVDAETAARIAADSAEATARTNSDTTLQNNIDAEATTRAAADTTLQNNINTVSAAVTAEATARTNADAALQTQINNLSTSSTTDLTALQDALDQEILDRQTADTTEAAARALADSNEATTRANADTTLQNNITAEATARAAADAAIAQDVTDLEAALAAETTNRTNADNTLQSNITTVSTALATEVSRATTAEANLSSDIATEEAARIADVAALQADLAQEAIDRSSLTMQTIYDQSTAVAGVANIKLTTGKDFRITDDTDNTIYFQVDAESGSVSLTGPVNITGDLNVSGAVTEITSTVTNSDHIALKPEGAASALIVNPGSGSTAAVVVDLKGIKDAAASAIRIDNDNKVRMQSTVYANELVVDSAFIANATGGLKLNAELDANSNQLINVADGSAAKDAVNFGQLSAEAASRAAAITSVEGQISAEATARTAADNAIRSDLASNLSSKGASLVGVEDLDGNFAGMNVEEILAELQTNIEAVSSGGGDALADETAARIAADAALQTALNTEISNRQTADSAETAARIAADDTLQANIDAEATTRANADTTLSNSIAAETLARTGADTTLQNNINAEAASRISADNTLQANIDAEATARTAAVTAEAAARTAADATLQASIDATDADLAAETAARIAADTAILTNYASTATAKGASLIGIEDVGALITSTHVEGALAEIATNLNTEAATRATADTNLQSAINTANTALANETSNRMAADATLQTNIDSTNTALSTESAQRIANDNTLQANIDAEVAARVVADTAIVSDLASTDTNKGASLVGVKDAGSLFSATTVEGVLAELQANISSVSGDGGAALAAETAARIAADTTLQANIDLKADQATTYTKVETDARIQAVVAAAPAALDTLNELAAALGNDANFAATVTGQLALKANSADVYTKLETYNKTEIDATFAALPVITASTGLVKVGNDIQIGAAAAGEGLSVVDGVLAVNAGNGLAVNSDAVQLVLDGTTLVKSVTGVKVGAAGITSVELATGVAGNGLTGGAGTALSVVTGDGVEIVANAVKVKLLSSNSGLVLDASGLRVDPKTMTTDRVVVRDPSSGVCDGVNTTFILNDTPLEGSEAVYLNGVMQEPGAGNDYSISGNTITFFSAPFATDRVRVSYITAP